MQNQRACTLEEVNLLFRLQAYIIETATAFFFFAKVATGWRRLKWQHGDTNLRRIKLCTKVAQFSMSFSVIFKEGFLVLCIFFCVHLNMSLIVRECK